MVGAYEYSSTPYPVKYHPLNHVIDNTQEEDTTVSEYEMIPGNTNVYSLRTHCITVLMNSKFLDSYGRAGELYQ